MVPFLVLLALTGSECASAFAQQTHDLPAMDLADPILTAMIGAEPLRSKAFETLREAAATDGERLLRALIRLPFREGRLPRGYSVLDLPGYDPSHGFAVILPAVGEPPATGWPLVVGGSSMPTPPHEYLMRNLMSSWLERGFAVLFPRTPGLGGAGKSQDHRDPYADRDLLPAMIALLEVETPIDRDRIFYSPAPWDVATAHEHTIPAIDATLLAGLHAVLLGGSTLGTVRNAPHYAGRTVLLHHSDYEEDSILLARARLRWIGAHPIETIKDSGLNDSVRFTIDHRAPEFFLTVRRKPPLQELTLEGHGSVPSRHEWIETVGPLGATRLRGKRSGDSIDLTTETGTIERIPALNLYLAEVPSSFTVRYQGRPVFGGTVPHGREQQLLCLRYRMLTGREAARVIQIRP